MLGRSANDRLTLAVKHLVSLTLADRVIAKNGHAVAGEQVAYALIIFVSLAVITVAAWHDHSGKRRFSFRDIKIGGDVVIGPALEDDFLDAVAVPFQSPDDARIERRAFGHIAE